MSDSSTIYDALNDLDRACTDLHTLAIDLRTRALAQDGAYLIWSHEHAAWWKPASSGYTRHLSTAGRYPRDVALRICRGARGGWRPGNPPPEIPVREEDALAVEPTPSPKAPTGDGFPYG